MKRDLIFVSVGRFFAAVVALVSIRVVTTLLTADQYGELALLLAVQMLCSWFLINPVAQHINLHTHAWWDDGTLSARLRGYRRYVLAVSLLGGVVVIGLNKFNITGPIIGTAIAMFVMVIGTTWNATLIPILNMLGYRASSVLWSTISVVAGLVSSILFVMWLQSATAWFVGQAIGMVIGAFGARIVLQRHELQQKCDQTNLQLISRNTVVTYCLPLALATGLMWMQLSGYRFLIENYWGFAQLGFLVVGLQLAGQVFSLAESLAMQFLYPLFYRRVTDHEKKIKVEQAFSDLLNTLVPVYIVIAGFLVLSAQYLMQLLVAPHFKDCTVFIVLGTGIEFCRVLGNLVGNAAHVKRNTQSLALPYAVGALVILVLICLAGELKVKIYWAAVALFLGALAMLMTMLISMYRQINFSLDYKRCLFSLLIMLSMTILALSAPKVSGLIQVLGMLILSIIPSILFVLILLWKSPAVLRLLNTRLRNS